MCQRARLSSVLPVVCEQETRGRKFGGSWLRKEISRSVPQAGHMAADSMHRLKCKWVCTGPSLLGVHGTLGFVSSPMLGTSLPSKARYLSLVPPATEFGVYLTTPVVAAWGLGFSHNRACLLNHTQRYDLSDVSQTHLKSHPTGEAYWLVWFLVLVGKEVYCSTFPRVDCSSATSRP